MEQEKIESFCWQMIDSHSWVGKMRHFKNEWIDTETMKIIKQRKNMHEEWLCVKDLNLRSEPFL